MKGILLLMIMVIGGLLGSGISAQAADPTTPRAQKETAPAGRLSDGTIKGTLLRTEGEYYFIKDPDGIEQKIHVDKTTKLDKVKPGDRVRAYVTDEAHTTALTVLKGGN